MASITTGTRGCAPCKRAVRLCPTVRAPRSTCWAGKGFGQSNRKQTDTRGGYIKQDVNQRLAKELGLKAEDPTSKLASQAPDAELDGWKMFGKEADLFQSGNVIKAVELGARAFAVYRWKGRIYVSDANSTAFKYPLIDAKIIEGAEGRPVIEVPLDGTQYDLETGKVVVWCPGNGPVRSVLGALKQDAPKEDLRVYPVEVVQGKIFVNVRGK